MQNVFSTTRIRAGLYISGDSRFRIKRRMDMHRRRWVWDVSVLSDGEYRYSQTFRTLAIAREYVARRTMWAVWHIS